MSDLVDLAGRDEPDDDLRLDLVRKQWAKFQDDVKLTLDKLRMRLTPLRFRQPERSLTDDESTVDARSRWNVRSTLDLYARFTLTKPVRFRAKTSLYPMRYVAIKGEASGSVGVAPDISLEIKLLDVFKYRMRGGNTTGGNTAQLRIRTPLRLKGAEMDVIYERRSLLLSNSSSSSAVPGPRDGVRVAFRFADSSYLKVPNATVAVKSRSRVLKPFKTTLRIKRVLEPPPPPTTTTRQGGEMSALERLDRVGNILMGRRPADEGNNINSRPPRPASSAAARPARQAQEREELASEETVSLFEAARKFLAGTVKADDVGIDVKYRWVDTRG